MAEALAKKIIQESPLNIEVISRGISVYFPSSASNYAHVAMKEYDIDLKDHKSKGLESKDMENADLILTMTQGHKHYLLLNFPEYGKKIYTIKEFTNENGDIEDPFGGNLDSYKNCAANLNRVIKKAIKTISRTM